MKKIFIKIEKDKKLAFFSKQPILGIYRYYDYMLVCPNFNNDNLQLNMIELKDKKITTHIILLNLIAFIIIKRSKQEALIIIKKNHKVKYYIAHKSLNKYYADFGYIVIKEKESTIISKQDDLVIFSQRIFLKFSLKNYDSIYENNNQIIYTIKRIID